MIRRNVAAVIIFSILTFGIYQLYWIYDTMSEMQETGVRFPLSPIKTVVLSFFFPNIGFAVSGYGMRRGLNVIRERRVMEEKEKTPLYVLAGFLFPFVLIAILQSEINHLV